MTLHKLIMSVRTVSVNTVEVKLLPAKLTRLPPMRLDGTIQDVARRKCNVLVTKEADSTTFAKFCEDMFVKRALARMHVSENWKGNNHDIVVSLPVY